MQNTLDLNLEKMKRAKTKHLRMISILLVLSLLVSLDVFWVLRRTGITMAGDAACGRIAKCAEIGTSGRDFVCAA